MTDRPCCRTCVFCSELQRWDYSNLADCGVIHRVMGGFACTAFTKTEHVVIHHVGSNIDRVGCEMYQPRKGESNGELQ